MTRNQAYYRWQRQRIIQKKVGVLKRLGGEALIHAWTQGQYGRLAKGKIHCSCSMCRLKSYDIPSHRDQKLGVNVIQQLQDDYSCFEE